MIGQKKLLEKLNKYTIDSFPRSIILMGEEGSGKHTISEYIKENILKLPLYDITGKVSNEYINKIYLNPNPAIYLINLNDMTEKEENVLLKFIEEPLANSFIILLAESRVNVLNTILNRCIVFEMDSYSKDELSNFISEKENKDLILNVVRTPGKIKSIDFDNLVSLYSLCDNIVNKLSIASYSNTLSIVDKINYKEDYNKYDINLFFDTLIYKLFNAFVNSHNIKLYNMYIKLINERKKLLDKRLNKELFMTNLLSNLWRLYNDK